MSDESLNDDGLAQPPEPPPPLWMRIPGMLGGAFLGAVLLVAAWAKTLDPAAFAQQISFEGLDFLLPAGAVALIALALEVFLGSALLLLIRRWWILLPTAALVVFFLLLTGRAYLRFVQGIELADDPGCGCFGNLVQRTPAQAFWQDALLMVPALLLAFVARGASRHTLPRVRLALVTALTAATVLIAWKAAELPLDNLATRLRPGTDLATLCAGTVEDGTRICVDGILPEVARGEHVVILADVTGEIFSASVERLNEYHWAGLSQPESTPALWILTANTEEEIFGFRFGKGPAFELRDAPPALLRPLYRTLPRSFLVRDGRVIETYSGLPPLDKLTNGEPMTAANLDRGN